MTLSAPTPAEQDVLTRLRDAVHAAGYPKTYRVDRETLETVLNYFQRMQAESVAAWKAAGEPEEWPYPLWWMYSGPNMGLYFKAVELLPA